MSAPAPASTGTFGARAARGTLWTTLRYVAEYSIRLGSNLVLTRLLFPEAFGLMALVNTLMVGLAMFSDIGLATSVVQSPRGDDPRFLRTAWTLQVLRGLVLFGMGAALGPPMAAFYGQEELRGLVPIASLTALVGGFNSIALIQMQRHLELGRLAAIELASQVISTGLTVLWAYLVPSVWALAGGAVVGSLLKLALSHALAHGEPSRFGWERPAARQLIEFGKWIFVSTLLFFLAGQADRLLFGKLLSVGMLGVYGIALVLAGLPTQLLWSIGNFVFLPTFSRQAGTPEAFLATYRQVQLPVLILGGLPVAGLLACGPELIELLYDARYADAGWMIQLLAVGVGFQIPQTLTVNALLALGGPRWMAGGNASKLAGTVVFVPLGYGLFGAAGAIGGLAAAETVRWLTYAVGAERRGLPGFRPDLACTVLVLVAGGAGLLGMDALRARGFAALPRLAIGTAGILAVWSLLAFLLRRELAALARSVRR